jgi:serine/threonine protein kinase
MNIQDLKTIYKKTENAQHIIHKFSMPRLKGTTYTVELRPVGFQRLPQSLSELKCAIRCVLEALSALHQAGFVHRDVRWENILVSPSDITDWILIDLEHAGKSGSVSYRLVWWPPGIGPNAEPYNPRCDLYLVGELIRLSGVTLGNADIEFMDSLQDMATRFTATKALRDSWFI